MNLSKYFSTAFKAFALLALAAHFGQGHAEQSKCGDENFEYPSDFKASVYGNSRTLKYSTCAVSHPSSMIFDSFSVEVKSLVSTVKDIAPEKRRAFLAVQAFKAYCGEGHSQKMAMEEKVTVVLPSIAKGMPLDKAAQATLEIKALAEQKLSSMFVGSSYWNANSVAPAEDINHGAVFFTFPVKSSDNMLAHFKTASAGSAKSNQFISLVVDQKGGILMGWAGDLEVDRFTAKAGLYTHWLEPDFKKAKPYEGAGLNSIYQVQPSGGGLVLSEEQYFDLNLLTEAYTPASDKLSKVPADLVGQKEKIWADYLAKHTKVKVAQSEDPKIIKATVALDLNDFCSSAIEYSELVSN